jgi:ABC-type phosphate transport system substrate-binding protein
MPNISLLNAIILLGGLSFTSSATGDELVLVVHRDNPTSVLSRSQVIDLYMGKYVAFPDGSKAVPVDIKDNLETRTKFYDSLVGMSLPRINAYWSKVKFSGRARPPTEQTDEQAIVNFILKTENAIAYIHESSVTANVKVVYRFDE